jgi:hypothetical protein
VEYRTKYEISEKRKKLIDFANSVLDEPKYKDELNLLMKTLKLSRNEILDEYVRYDLDISIANNEDYSHLANRFVLHQQNLLKDSWHIERQAAVLNYLKSAEATTVADLGFGVPTKYVKELAIKHKLINVTLFDRYDSAFIFAEALLNQWDSSWHKNVNLMKLDMNENTFAGTFDLYLFLDSIEHSNNPEAYLKKYVQMSPKKSKFIFSLPICPLIPHHSLAWHNIDEGLNFITGCGLKIDTSCTVSVNKLVDLFAEQLNFECKSLIVLCRKQ